MTFMNIKLLTIFFLQLFAVLVVLECSRIRYTAGSLLYADDHMVGTEKKHVMPADALMPKPENAFWIRHVYLVRK